VQQDPEAVAAAIAEAMAAQAAGGGMPSGPPVVPALDPIPKVVDGLVLINATLTFQPDSADAELKWGLTLAMQRNPTAALPHLRETHGSVINIGSVNAYSGEPNLMPYSVSKGALMTLTRNLGDTLMREDGVRVNQINPGWVLTENEAKRKREHGLKDDWYADLPKVYAPAGRILWPEEIAACAAWLLADECGPISGQVFDLEQHPFIGRNPPKDSTTIPSK
jgi:NAD(P)-dependent dehydrogenase (short-subunit alcohol dehydrogenase family)